MTVNKKTYAKYAKIARGLEKADLVLKNAKVVNVFTEEIYEADVAVTDGLIVGVGTYEGKREDDMTGCYVVPGFIDSHLHFETTMVMPGELVGQAVQWGTTTFIADPHEAANVAGTEGIDFILQQTENVPANVYVMMPSCVPATSIDQGGAVIDAELMKPYLENPRILGLGEVMDYVSVVNAEETMHDKLELFQDKILDGHAPFLEEKDLSAYALAGISTDHECIDFEYAMQERRRGMTVHIREGSGARNLEAIVRGIVEHHADTDGFCFCTDDKHLEEIRKEGHVSFNVKKAISLGISPVKAIKMATIQAARCYGLKHLGAIAPGYQADMVVLKNLEQVEVEAVYHKGVRIQKDAPVQMAEIPGFLKQTVNLSDFSRESLMLPKAKGKQHVIQMLDGQIVTRDIEAELPGTEYFVPNEEFQKIAVVDRYRNSGKAGVGVVTGFGIRHGAIASSVSHDSHNIIVIGDNDEDMELAVRELTRTQGGYTLVEKGKVFDTLALPVMGLISDAGYRTVEDKLKRMIPKAHEMGVSKGMDPFITLSFMALPVIPEIRITPDGVYSVTEQKFYEDI